MIPSRALPSAIRIGIIVGALHEPSKKEQEEAKRLAENIF